MTDKTVLYIVNWPYHEHADSAKAARAKRSFWVKAKVDFNGDDWLTLMRHKDAADALAVWEILRGIAQQSPYRGLILTDGHAVKPHTVASISDKTRCRTAILRRGLAVLQGVLGWVSTTQATGDWRGLSLDLWGESYDIQGKCAKPIRKPSDDSPANVPPSVGKASEDSPTKVAPTERTDNTEQRERGASAEKPPTETDALSRNSEKDSTATDDGKEESRAEAHATCGTGNGSRACLSGLAELIRVRTAWGITNLEKCTEAADKLLVEYADRESEVAEWIGAHITPGVKPWEIYALWRKGDYERKRVAREAAAKRRAEAEEQERQEKARAELAAMTPEERQARRKAVQDNLRKLGVPPERWGNFGCAPDGLPDAEEANNAEVARLEKAGVFGGATA